MSDASAAANGREVARLEAMAAGDPGAPVFAALAEAYRRQGDPERAEQSAREGLRRRPDQIAGRVALGLALLDQGRVADARHELERALDAVPDHAVALAALDALAAPAPDLAGHSDTVETHESASSGAQEALDEIGEGELDRAFADAESDPEQMVDADDIARQAMRAASLDEPEGVAASTEPPRPGLGIESPFATRTMASLLERQGHHDDARALLEAIEPVAPAGPREAAGSAPATAARSRQRRGAVIRTLERWLDNLRRGTE